MSQAILWRHVVVVKIAVQLSYSVWQDAVCELLAPMVKQSASQDASVVFNAPRIEIVLDKLPTISAKFNFGIYSRVFYVSNSSHFISFFFLKHTKDDKYYLYFHDGMKNNGRVEHIKGISGNFSP